MLTAPAIIESTVSCHPRTSSMSLPSRHAHPSSAVKKFPPLPAPVHFTDPNLPAAPGVLAAMMPSGPYFLDQLAHDQCLEWAGKRGNRQVPTVLTLLGPFKSCKSALLTTIVPGMLVANREAGEPCPVFFAFEFGLTDAPEQAATRLLVNARAFAKTLGLVLDIPDTPADCLLVLGETMEQFATLVADAGGELVVLLDEVQVSRRCDSALFKRRSILPATQLLLFRLLFLLLILQAPILRAATPADAEQFAATLKRVATGVCKQGRLALTGSGMVTLLTTLRNVPANWYLFWSALSRVHLGATPTREAAIAIAGPILAARAGNWPEAAKASTTPEVVVDMLTSRHPGVTSARPALVAHLADLMQTAGVGEPRSIRAFALSDLVSKLQYETQADAAVALEALTPLERTGIFDLACERVTHDRFSAHIGGLTFLRTSVRFFSPFVSHVAHQ